MKKDKPEKAKKKQEKALKKEKKEKDLSTSKPKEKKPAKTTKAEKEPDTYVKKKKEMIFQSVESLQQVVNVVNEAAFALNDKSRTIRESAIPEVLAGALGAGIGGVGSFAALYGLGVVGLIRSRNYVWPCGSRCYCGRRHGRWSFCPCSTCRCIGSRRCWSSRALKEQAAPAGEGTPLY